MNVKKREEAVQRCEAYRKMGYACSESVFRALADVFAIPVSRELCRSISIFAGGAAYDGRCGVLEAGLALTAVLEAQGRITPLPPGQRQRQMHQLFAQEHDGFLCSQIFYPRYEEYKKCHESEEDFQCVFMTGISLLADYMDGCLCQGGPEQ